MNHMLQVSQCIFCNQYIAYDTNNRRPWQSIGSLRMCIGSAVPDPGGRAEGQAEGGQTGCFELLYNDVHRFSQKDTKNRQCF